MGEGNFPFFNYLLMFKLIRTTYQNETQYLLVDSDPLKVNDKGDLGLLLLGSTFSPDPQTTVHIIKFEQIDELILENTEVNDWIVEVDSDYNIYLKEQLI